MTTDLNLRQVILGSLEWPRRRADRLHIDRLGRLDNKFGIVRPLTRQSSAILTWAVLFVSVSASANAAEPGWLEGNVKSADNGLVNHINSPNLPSVPVYVRGLLDGRQVFSVQVQRDLDGLYVARDIEPGNYELLVSDAGKGSVKLRPQRIFGVTVKPNVRTKFNIRLNPGSELEEIGKPSVQTETVVVITERLDEVGKQIAELKAELQRVTTELKEIRELVRGK